MTSEIGSFQFPKTSHLINHTSELTEDVHPQTTKGLLVSKYNASPHGNAPATAGKGVNWLDCFPLLLEGYC